MKKLIFTAAITFLFLGFGFGQSLQKGNVFGVHVLTVTLKPGVTMDQYIDFLKNKYMPEMQKNFPEIGGYILKGVRGENENKFGMMFSFKSVEARDKYFPTPDTMSDLANEGLQKMKPLEDELMKLGTYTTVYTDWVIQ